MVLWYPHFKYAEGLKSFAKLKFPFPVNILELSFDSSVVAEIFH